MKAAGYQVKALVYMAASVAGFGKLWTKDAAASGNTLQLRGLSPSVSCCDVEGCSIDLPHLHISP